MRVGGPVVSYLSAGRHVAQRADRARRRRPGRVPRQAVDGGIDPGTCTPGNANAQGYIVQVFCPVPQRVRVDLGDREDTATVALDVPATILAGTGVRPRDAAARRAATRSTAAPAQRRRLDGGSGRRPHRRRRRRAGHRPLRAGQPTRSRPTPRDTVDPDCETVTRAGAPPPGDGAARRRARPAGARRRRRRACSGDDSRSACTPPRASRRPSAPPGFLDAAGLELPIERLDTRAVTVGGGGVVLDYRIRGRHARAATRALARKRKVLRPPRRRRHGRDRRVAPPRRPAHPRAARAATAR